MYYVIPDCQFNNLSNRDHEFKRKHRAKRDSWGALEGGKGRGNLHS